MNDYKELIERLRNVMKSVVNPDGSGTYYFVTAGDCAEAADAIEQLVRERNAAVADLKNIDTCSFCKHRNDWKCQINGECEWEWRGVQDETC